MFKIKKRGKWALLALTTIFALRMLGLFMILPVFAVYATQLNHVNPLLIGIALGIYGLTQALLQIPFGCASDRLGRKPIIMLGLLLLAVGSVVAAFSDSIYGIIVGRGLQGASAIGCVLTAYVADLTSETVRVRAMAVIGITIGLSFALAMALGPLLSEWQGVPGLFWITAGFALIAMLMLLMFVPTPVITESDGAGYPVLQLIPKVLIKPELRVLAVGAFILHASLVALFLKIPLAVQNLGFEEGAAWQFYLPLLFFSLLAAAFGLLWLEKRSQVKNGLTFAVLTLVISECSIGLFSKTQLGLAISLWMFFTAFNILEASLPALVVQYAPKQSKGTALGLYSSSQFLGLFAGGVMGGWLDANYGMVAIMSFCIILTVVWLIWDFSVNFKRGLPCQEG